MILIFVDYTHKSSTDRLQRTIFCNVLIFSFSSAIFDALYAFICGMPGHSQSILANSVDNIHFLLQVLAFYYIFIFIDYTIFRETERARKITIAVWIIFSLHIFVFIFDMWAHYSALIDPGDSLWQSIEYFIKSTLCYLPVLFMIFDFFSSNRADKKSRRNMVLLFAIIIFLGLVLDTVFSTANLIWPCLTAALLYAYFVIIRTDIQIDSLTGIGNRYSFNEFINRLSRLNTVESYAIVMIDMDHLKEINDAMGHQEGDNALRDMASIIRKCIRSSDFAARYGGDEFILATNAKYEIEKLMERIQNAVDAQNEKHLRPFRLQISYGYDVFTTNQDQTIEEFLVHIDQLMYRDKENHRRAGDSVLGAEI